MLLQSQSVKSDKSDTIPQSMSPSSSFQLDLDVVEDIGNLTDFE